MLKTDCWRKLVNGGAVVGMVLGFWQVHVNAQQVTGGVNTNTNTQVMDLYVTDACARLRLAGGGQSSSANSNTSGAGVSLTSVASRSTVLAAVQPAALSNSQTDLLTRCANIAALSADGDFAAVDQVNATDFNAIKLDALLFADSQRDETQARLRALRQSRSDATAQNMDLRYNNQPLLAVGDGRRGGGASADTLATESPWGIWGRINRASGDKDDTALAGPFDMTATGYTLGMDYRSAAGVLGMSIGVRNANIDFGNHGERGGIDNRTTTLSAYAASYFVGNFYVDGIVNYSRVSYDTTRRIAYDEFGTLIDRTALGNTDGRTLSVGGSLGYDKASGAFTITPSLGYFYIDTKTDAFAEHGADGLNLALSEQRYRSSSARLQLNSSYAIKTSRGVLLPYARVEMIKEFKDEVDMFGVRFVDDPDATASVPVTIEALDDLYYRLALGMSAQFRRELSAYLDCQIVSGFQSVSYWSASAGLRKQF